MPRTVNPVGGIIIVLLLFIFMGMLLLMLQSNQTCAQDNKLARPKIDQERVNLRDDRNRNFYRVIIENNLFRPLGWRQPRRKPGYVLIATWVESNGETAKALIMERSSNHSYYATIGETVGNAVIENIESKQVDLKISGEILTLKIP